MTVPADFHVRRVGFRAGTDEELKLCTLSRRRSRLSAGRTACFKVVSTRTEWRADARDLLRELR